MSQFFILPEKIKNNRFIMETDESHHILRVMRQKSGEKITVFDGQGNKYLAEIEEVKNKAVHGRILETLASTDYKIKLNLCFSAVSKLSIDFILKHCTEIGVHSFQPVISERTQFKIDKNWETKTERFRKIFISACKQSGRAKLPLIMKPCRFAELFRENTYNLVANQGKNSIAVSEVADRIRNAGVVNPVRNPHLEMSNEHNVLTNSSVSANISNGVNLIIGPEGGFSPSEIEFAQKHQGLFVSLGKYILRTEIACVVASSMLLNLLEKK